jgi:hypothetical protein
LITVASPHNFHEKKIFFLFSLIEIRRQKEIRKKADVAVLACVVCVFSERSGHTCDHICERASEQEQLGEQKNSKKVWALMHLRIDFFYKASDEKPAGTCII